MKKLFLIAIMLLLFIFVSCKLTTKKTITLYDGTTILEKIKVEKGETILDLRDPAKEGYDFENWYTEESFENVYDFSTSVKKSFSLYAKFIDLSSVFEITFNSNGGTNVLGQNITYKNKATVPTNPTKEGYTFENWYLDEYLTTLFDFESPIKNDMTLYAKWTDNSVKTYVVTFFYYGESDNRVTHCIKNVNENELVPVPEKPVLSGYKFINWYTSWSFEDEFDFSSPIVKNTTIYGKLVVDESAQTYTITYNSNGGTAITNDLVYENELLTAPNEPTKTGYDFVGWYKEATLSNAFDFSVAITEDITLYAKWKAKEYSVTYDLDGGNTSNSNPATVTHNGYAANILPTKSGYDFVGWYMDEELTTVYNFSAPVTSNLTLYAKWKTHVIKNYIVTFNSNGGTSIPAQNITEGNKATLPTNPTKDGCIFEGWYSNSTLTSIFSFQTIITSSMTLYAKWSAVIPTGTAIYSGYNEGLFVTINDNNASSVNVSYKSSSEADYINVDKELIRQINATQTRVDILGLKEGSYDVKLTTSSSQSVLIPSINVYKHDRSGYAHFDYSSISLESGIGGYNDDGTVKDNAVIVYVTDETKNTVKATLGGTVYTGLSAILQNQRYSSFPLIVRLIGRINAATWKDNGRTGYKGIDMNGNPLPNQNMEEGYILSEGINVLDTTTYTKLNGLTNKIKLDGTNSWDSYYNMLDVSSAKNLTVEGVGTDAMIFQWGFTFKSCTSIEIRNIVFDDYTEDACSFEGANDATSIAGFTTGRIWLHNNTFNRGINYFDVCEEQDKHDGDGATDFKKIAFVTISYNRYYDNHKTGLINGSDSQHSACITFHHNFYDQCQSRLPFARQANMHMYNNYYYGSTGNNMQIYAGAYAFIEACYFENVKNPMVMSQGAYTLPAAKLYQNTFVNCSGTNGGTVVTSRTATVSNGNIYGTTFDTNNSIFYYDSANQVSDVLYLTNSLQAKADCLEFAGVLKDTDKINCIYTEAVNYTVTYNSNGGSSVNNSVVKEGNILVLPTNPTKTNYAFAGWYTDSSLTTKYTASSVNSNFTLYAKWDTPYTITFNSNGGSSVTSIVAANGESITAPSNPTKNGYTFKGWYTDNNTFLNSYNFSIMGSSNITLYAKWDVYVKPESLDLDLSSLEGNITASTEAGDFTILATAAKTVNVSTVELSMDGLDFNYCLALSGGGDITYRAISITIMETSTFTIYAKSGNESTARTLKMVDGSSNEVGSKSITTLEKITFSNITAGTYYIFSGGSGINIYYASVE